MRLLDSDLLVRFLHEREHRSTTPLVQAIYAGLDARINRGDFDHKDS